MAEATKEGSSPLLPRASKSGHAVSNPLYARSKARPASLIIPKQAIVDEEDTKDAKSRRSKSSIKEQPAKEPSSPLIKRSFTRSRSGTAVSNDSISSGDASPGG